MEGFRIMSVTACFLGIVITIFNSLYPSEKFAKQVKIIFSLIFILSVIKPFAAEKLVLPETEYAVSASAENCEAVGDNVYRYFISSVEENISASVAARLRENNIYPEEIKTSINISDNGSISINEVIITLKDSVQSSEAERCVKEATESGVTVIVKESGNAGND